MTTPSGAGTGLEDLLLAALRSDTELGDGLYEKLNELMRWLTQQPRGDLSRIKLLTALVRLQERAAVPAEEAAASADDTVAEEATPEPPPPSLTERTVAELRSLWQLVAEDTEAMPYCSGYHEPAEAPAPDLIGWLWTSLHLVCLRLSTANAAEILKQAEGAVAEYQEQEPAPLPRIRVADDDAEHTQLRSLADALSPRWQGLPETIISMNWLAYHDGGVKLAHNETLRGGMEFFNPVSRTLYTQNLTSTLQALLDAAAGSPEEAERLTDLDAALRGVVPLPLPLPGSWWTTSLDRCLYLLKQHPQAGKIQTPDLKTQNLTEWQKLFDRDSIPVARKETPGGLGRSGDRVWILRYPVVDERGELKKGRYISVE